MNKHDLREDLATAAILSLLTYLASVGTLSSMVPEADLLIMQVNLGVTGGPWMLSLLPAAVLAYLMCVDALLPVGSSKGSLLRRTTRHIVDHAHDALSANEWWHMRIAVAMAAVLVVCAVSDLLS